MTKSKLTFKTGTLCLLSIMGAAAIPTNVMAEDVTLRSSDGTVNLTGEFLEFADNAYVIRTPLGDLRISSSRVTCDGAACPVFEAAEADVQIAGSDTIGFGLMPLLMEGYAGYMDAAATINATNNDTEILAELIGDGGFGDDLGSYLVSSTASGDAFKALLDNTAEIGMASRRIKPAEARSLRDAGAGNMVSPSQEHILAIDSLVVITHPENNVDALTMEQLRGIYSGEITNWSEVGGADMLITVVGQADGSGTRAVFEERIFGDAPAVISADALISESASVTSETVNSDAGAIGVVGYAFQRGAKPLTVVNECGIEMKPDAFSARTEEYALQRRLYLYNRADTLDEATASFLQYATSTDADGVIAKSGFIGLGIDRKAQTLDDGRAQSLLDPNADRYEAVFMRDMLSKMVDYDRLSTTFRFRTGSSKLDERGRIDMSRLASFLETMPAGTDVTFVGFTDSVGAFDANRQLSEGRAQQVLNELSSVAGDRLNGINMTSVGYGEIAPSGCNIDEEGRRINRRVEVWIKSTI